MKKKINVLLAASILASFTVVPFVASAVDTSLALIKVNERSYEEAEITDIDVIEQKVKDFVKEKGYNATVAAFKENVLISFKQQPIGEKEYDTTAIKQEIKTFCENNSVDSSLVQVIFLVNDAVEKVKGDANCDGELSMADPVMIMQALANPNKYGIDGTAEKHLTEQGQINGDMDGDGLTVGDAQAIQRQLLGLSSNIEFHSSADYPCAIKINGTVFWQTDEGFCEDFSNYTINKVTAYSENGTPQNDGESNFDRKCNTEFIILDEKTIVVKLQEGKVGFWIFRAKDDKTSVLPKIKLYHSVSTTDAQYTEMRVNEVVSIETNYDPLMSDWSGIGILFEFESKDYPITLSTNEGHFTTWDIEAGSGPIENVGKTYNIGNEGYIFWTPDNLHYDENYVSEILIMEEKSEKNNVLGKIVVNQNDQRTLSAVLKEKNDTEVTNNVVESIIAPKIRLYKSNSPEELEYTEMKKGEVVSIETDYNPAMSDWSGIGILLEFESKDYPITLSTNEGHFTTWDKEEGSGIVTNVGKTYDIGNIGYIFWTPDNLNFDEDFESDILITGESNGKSIEVGKIGINMNDKHTLSAVLK